MSRKKISGEVSGSHGGRYGDDSFEMLLCVVWYQVTGVSLELTASIIRAALSYLGDCPGGVCKTSFMTLSVPLVNAEVLQNRPRRSC